MKKSKFGQGNEGHMLDQVEINGTTTHIEALTFPEETDNVSFQLVTEALSRSITVALTDSVVAVSHTWTFANGAFTASDVGAALTVSGATNANNNATVTIASVTNATTVVTNGTQTNETFSNGTTLASVVDVALAGTWKVKASNSENRIGDYNGQPRTGTFVDISTLFSTIAAVSAASDQYTQMANCAAKCLEVSFTRSSGFGKVSAWTFQKGNG